MNKALLVDCDQTIRKPASRGRFPRHARDQRVIAGADRALSHFAARGYLCIAISNQGGVGAGHKTLTEAIDEARYTLELFPQLVCAYFCPDMKGRFCWQVERNQEKPLHSLPDFQPLSGSFRKPGAGMLQAAAIAHDLCLEESLYVGDRHTPPKDEDLKAAQAAGIPFIPAQRWREDFVAIATQISESRSDA